MRSTPRAFTSTVGAASSPMHASGNGTTDAELKRRELAARRETVRKLRLGLMIAAGVGGLSLAADRAAAQGAHELSMMSFGGAYQAAEHEAFVKPYEAATGIKVVEQEYGGEIAKIKAMVQSGAVTVDVVDVDAPTMLEGCDDGIYQTIDWSKIGPKSEWLAGTASDCGVGTISYGTVLTYNAAVLKQGPTSIADLFDTKKFPGKRGLWKTPRTNLEFALLADGVTPADVYKVLGTKEGVDRAFRKLDTIKKNVVWWEKGAQPMQMLAAGDVVMTTAWNGRVVDANKNGGQFRIVWDHELLDNDFWVIPKGVKDVDAAMKFIAFTVQPKVLAGITRYIPYGPVRTTANAFVDPKDATNLPTSPANMQNALTIDSGFWDDRGEELRRRFTNWLAQ